MSEERIYRRKAGDWKAVILELHADRGMLLGSSQYGEMTGVERVKSLVAIDQPIYDAHTRIAEIEDLRDRAIPIPTGYKYRVKSIRNKIHALDDEALGVLE